MDERWHWHPTLPGVRQRYIDGFANDTQFHRQTVQDVEPILDRNKALQSEDGFDADRSMRRVASIPATVYYDWLEEWRNSGQLAIGDVGRERELIKARLRNPDFKNFRTSSGGI